LDGMDGSTAAPTPTRPATPTPSAGLPASSYGPSSAAGTALGLWLASHLGQLTPAEFIQSEAGMETPRYPDWERDSKETESRSPY
jgi:hypothetical protein